MHKRLLNDVATPMMAFDWRRAIAVGGLTLGSFGEMAMRHGDPHIEDHAPPTRRDIGGMMAPTPAASGCRPM